MAITAKDNKIEAADAKTIRDRIIKEIKRRKYYGSLTTQTGSYKTAPGAPLSTATLTKTKGDKITKSDGALLVDPLLTIGPHSPLAKASNGG